MAPEIHVANGLTQVRIGGYGGQGIVLAGLLLGKAASLYDGKEAVFTQSYGPEARGGASSADVVISDQSIDYPLVTAPDILVVLFQEAYTRFRPSLKTGGTLIIETDLVHPEEEETDFYGIPATRLAQGLGNKVVANVVVFGYLVGMTQVVAREAAEKAIQSTVKPETLDLNMRAFSVGYEHAKEKQKS